MAVLSNNVIAGASIADDAAGDDTYKIEKSLRCNFDDGGKLERGVTGGNTRKWTASWWMKRGEFIKDQRIFTKAGGGGGEFFFKMGESNNGTYPYKFFIRNNVGGTEYDAYTDMVFRDPTAWQHVVFNYDSANAIATERYRIYVNGVKHTFTYVHNDKCVQNGEAGWSSASSDMRVAGAFGGHLADVQFIDGLALSPAAFGSFDSTGVWNPKAFALPAPNTGGTWTPSSGGPTNAANMFDGSLSTSTSLSNSDGTKTVTTQSFTIKNSLRVYISPGSGYYFDWTINGIKYRTDGTGTTGWYTVDVPPNTEVTSFTVSMGPSSGDSIRAIEVDGVILVDGQTDPTTRDNPNNGTEWKNSSYNSGGDSNNYYKIFDGDNSDWMNLTNAASPYTFTPPAGIPIKSLRLLVENDTTFTCALNGGSAVSYPTPNLRYVPIDLADHSNITTLTSIALSSAAGGTGMAVRAIEINGQQLVSQTIDNSFHLKFNDTTKNRYLGKDTLNGKIEDATGGLPIYNTTDDYGDVKGSGNRTDSDSSDLKIALPLYNNLDDESGNNRDGTITGTTVAVTDQSRFYGGCYYFPGTGNASSYISIADCDELDFQGAWTIEYWVRFKRAPGTQDSPCASATDYKRPGMFRLTSGEMGYFSSSNGSSWDQVIGDGAATGKGTQVLAKDTWYHIAFQYDGSNKFTAYVNGVLDLDYTTSATGNSYNASEAYTLGRWGVAYGFQGWLQDFRIYGKVKYSSAFKPPTRNDFTVNNLSLTATTAGFKGINHAVNDSYSNQNYNGTIAASEAWTGTLAEVASGGFWGTDKIFWVDLGQSRTIEKFVWKLTSDGTGTAGTTAFIMWHTDNPASTGDTRCSGGCTVNTANTFSGSMSGDMTVTHDLGSGNTISKRYIGLSNGSGSSSTHFKCTSYNFTDANDGPVALSPCSYVDSPTNYEPDGGDTGAGGEVRGNYCTMNPLDKGSAVSFSQGNLTVSAPSGSANWDTRKTVGTMSMAGGKFYYEQEIVSKNAGVYSGVIKDSPQATSSSLGYQPTGYGYYSDNGDKYNNSSGSSYGNTFAAGDVVSIAFDGDTGTIWFAKNGTWQNSATKSEIAAGTTTNSAWTGIDTDMRPGFSCYEQAEASYNFGQRAWKYPNSVPDGFKALCTQNLDDTFSGDELNNPSKYFDVKTYTGNGSGDDGTSQSIKGVNFQPDLVWLKARTQSWWHHLFDVVRGAGESISSNSNNGEQTLADNQFTSFDSSGFTVVQKNAAELNEGGEKYVSWMWDAGTAAATASTDGTITPSAQWVNATAGFSITKYTGTQSLDTIGHGLNAKPDFIITKNLDTGGSSWFTYHSGIGATGLLLLDDNTQNQTHADWWNNTEPTNSVFTVNVKEDNNGDGDNHMAYCWTAIPGYSAFGKYTGTGTSTGPMVYCGFSPKWILTKNIDSSTNWTIFDTERDVDNVAENWLEANLTSEDQTHANVKIDILSNGFKLRGSDSGINASAAYIYAAFAEHPFKTARAR